MTASLRNRVTRLEASSRPDKDEFAHMNSAQLEAEFERMTLKLRTNGEWTEELQAMYDDFQRSRAEFRQWKVEQEQRKAEREARLARNRDNRTVEA